ncbi:MAG: hypothetical protein N4A43_02395 [Alphaproteobacteria bacterium]|jgi:hypothetical protein|nr:hypothetical protein [Alphaproteobacteria bacterium]
MFDFDNFVNKSCQRIFGQEVQYIPKNEDIESFNINGDFHEKYSAINLKNISSADISSSEIVLFVRMVEFPAQYKEPLQGDYIVVEETKYQVVNIEAHIPGSRKLILLEE